MMLRWCFLFNVLINETTSSSIKQNSVYWPASQHWRYLSVDSNVKVRIWRHAEIHPTPARFTFVFVCLTTFCLVSQLQRFIVMLMVLVWGITEKKRKKVYWHIHKENPCVTFWSFQVFSLLGYARRRSGQDELAKRNTTQREVKRTGKNRVR